VSLGPAGAALTQRGDGTLLLKSPHALGAYPARLTERLTYWADADPQRIFIAKRDASGQWRRLSYGETHARVRAIGQALLDRKLSPERPLAILSDNDIEHALLALAALHTGIPYAPISPAYSLVSSDFGKLKHILGLLTPGLVFAADGDTYAKALQAALPAATELVLTTGSVPGRTATSFDALEASSAGSAVDAAHARLGPDTIAKFLFTSGSTSQPKGVVNTQRMLCSNQQMLVQSLPFLAEVPPVMVDWLPWNHTFGGNHNFGIALYNGGTLYIDEGKPVPALIERTVANLREIAPTVYFNVPRGFEGLLPFLRDEPALRQTFFSRLQMLFYAGAGLSQPVWDELERLAVESCGERMLMITGLGATETAPSVTFANWPGASSGDVGLPCAGQEIKLVPNAGKLEIRVRGDNVTPGYWREPELTRAAFDAEGFYCMGDAVRFVDPEDPQKGLVFDGRVAEDFKLSTGTWVSVGPLRAHFLAACSPFAQDVVIAGHDSNFVCGLVFPNLAACRTLCPRLAAEAPAAEVLAQPELRARFQSLLDALSRKSTGSSTRIARILLLENLPQIDLGEITDKGSINQRAVLKHRAALVAELYAEPPSTRCIVADTPNRETSP
jgi:feruloyl-CoA synthase